MSLLLEAPVSAPEQTPSRRRRWLLVVAVLSALAGVLGSVSSLAPRAAAFGPASPAVSGATLVTVPEFGPRGAHILGYDHGRALTLTTTITNDGRLPVTVTSADVQSSPITLLDVRSVDGLPLRLGSGESGRITLRAVLTNCRYFHERALETYAGLEISFRSLGWSGTRTVTFDRPVMVKSPMLASCPNRLLDRQADRRSLLG